MTFLPYSLLAVTLGLVLVQELGLLVGFVAVQGALLGALAVALGYLRGQHELYWAGLLTLAVKAVAVPLVLRFVVRRVGVRRAIDTRLSTQLTALLALGLTVAAYYATEPLAAFGGFYQAALPVALTMLLIGLFLMVTRGIAFTQVVGLLVIENGLFLAALATARGLPLLVDVGILFDVLVQMGIAGLFVFRISHSFESIDTRFLRRLRG